jgi:Domain of unknown function (DUF4276)
MVEVTVLFEGGTHPNQNPNVETMDNTNKLRVAFSQLLNSGLQNPNVRVVTQPIYSNRNTKTVVSNWNPDDYLLIDLDGPPKERKKRIKDSGLSGIQESVFFMVQAMESWILSQPDAIDRTFAAFSNKVTKAEEDESLLEKHPENIAHPDRKLQAVLARHFLSTKGGQVKKLVYGKLRHAPDLIQNLDIAKLKATFSDVKMLLLKVEQAGT